MLPALEPAGVKLFAVGIGSAESAATFADRVEFPASLLFADESEESDIYAAVGTRNTQRDDNGKAVFEGVESMWSQKTNDALKKRGRDDLKNRPGSLRRLQARSSAAFVWLQSQEIATPASTPRIASMWVRILVESFIIALRVVPSEDGRADVVLGGWWWRKSHCRGTQRGTTY